MTNSSATPTSPRPSARHHRVLSMVLIAIASLLMFFGVLAIWINRQVVNTDNWTNTSSEMLQNATIRNEVAGYLVDQLYSNTDVQARLAAALPARAKPLAGPAAGGLREVAERSASELLQRPRVQAAWEQANRQAHKQFLNVLEGGGQGVSTTNGTVTLDLKTLLSATSDRVGVGGRIAGRIPASAARITILKSKQLDAAQRGLRVLRHLPIVLVGLGLLLGALAVTLARGWRRQAVRDCGLGLIAVGVAALVVRSIAGRIVVDQLTTTASEKPTVRAVWSIGTELLDQVAVATIVYGAFTVVGAWLAGPTAWATGVRATLAPYLREPRYAWGAFGIFVAVMAWWAPTPAMRNPVTGTLLAALVALGLEALRRQTAREYPDADIEEAVARRRAALRRMGDRATGGWRREPAAPVAAPASDGEQQRLDTLERLARLHDHGVIDDAEFEQEKARVLA